MPNPSSSLERRRLLVAVAALVVSRHAAGRPQGSTPLATAPRLDAGMSPAPSPDAAFGPVPAIALAPQLAGVYAGQVDPARCFVSEKYDGVRALWDGRFLRHRSGRAVSAPPSFIASLPAAPLDGELWLGRGRFDALSARIRRAEPDERDWREVRYMVFDTPVDGMPSRHVSSVWRPWCRTCRRGSRSRRSGASPTGSSSNDFWRERSRPAGKD